MFLTSRLTGARLPGLYLHKHRIGIVQPSMGSYIFVTLEPDGNMFIESVLEIPQKLGLSWQSALSEACLNHFTEEKWRVDYREFVGTIKEQIEDALLDDEDDSSLIYYDRNDDENRIKWNDSGVESRVYTLVKEDVVKMADWYTDDNGLDRGLEYMKAVPQNIILTGVYNWIDYKRVVFLNTLQRNVYQSVLDIHLD